MTRRGDYKPESSRFGKKVRETLFAKRQPRRDRNARAPFREKAKERCYRCEQLGRLARECQSQASKDHPGAPACGAMFFSCQVTHVHNCIISLLTWRVQPCRTPGMGLQTFSKPRPIGTHPMTSRNNKLPVANRIFATLSVWFWDQPVV